MSNFYVYNIIEDEWKLTLCGSRKYPYSHHGGNWKFQGGGGGVDGQINFQIVQFDSGPA